MLIVLPVVSSIVLPVVSIYEHVLIHWLHNPVMQCERISSRSLKVMSKCTCEWN